MENILDLIIIGKGPAGVTAAIYAKRAGLNFIVLKNPYEVDSQILNTYDIDNYTGFFKLSGSDLYNNFNEHLKYFNIDVINEKVIDIKIENDKVKNVTTKKNSYKSKTVIVATGAKPKKLGIDNEDKYVGMGLSYCATCDGAFYKDKTVAVIGSGNVAVEDSVFLSRICKKVYLIIRKDKMKADKILQEEILKLSNVEILFNTSVKNIQGENKIEKLVLSNDMVLDVDGFFVAIGNIPNTEFISNLVETKDGYIVASENCESSISGIYGCGDVRTKQLYQVITACSDGANAITSVSKYLSAF